MGANSQRALAQVRLELTKRNTRAGITIVNNVKPRTPVDQGRLRASYTSEADANGVRVGTDVPYGVFVELGYGKYVPGGRTTPWVYHGSHGWVTTSGHPPQPHLLPGFMESLPAIRRIYGEEIG